MSKLFILEGCATPSIHVLEVFRTCSRKNHAGGGKRKQVCVINSLSEI